MSKGEYDFLKAALQGNPTYRAVYSYENIKEIARGDKGHEEAIRCLEDVGALYLEIVVTKEFKVTDEARISPRSPREVFEFHMSPEQQMFERVLRGMNQFSHKMFGGRQNDDFHTVVKDQQKVFDELMTYLKEMANVAAEDLGDFQQVFMTMAERYADAKSAEFREVSTGLATAMGQDVPDQRKHNAAKQFRERVAITPLELNNIKPPKVIEQIWGRILACGLVPPDKLTMNQFFGAEPHSFQGDARPTWVERINGSYHQLNFLGYHQDEDLHKERRFISSQSDHGHAGYAAYASMLLSCDKRFILKTQAVYEFFKINTSALLLNEQGDIASLNMNIVDKLTNA